MISVTCSHPGHVYLAFGHEKMSFTLRGVVAVPFPAPGTTILVVDDERITRRVAYRSLSEEGYRVFEAASAEEALSVLDLAHRYIHLVILDVVMPVIDGVELGRRILARWPSLRLLYMSAHPAQVLSERGLDDLRVRFLAKPFTHDELLGKVQETLARRGARRSSGAESVVDQA